MKNSWGEDWGESGYVYMIRGRSICHFTDYGTWISWAFDNEEDDENDEEDDHEEDEKEDEDEDENEEEDEEEDENEEDENEDEDEETCADDVEHAASCPGKTSVSVWFVLFAPS